MYKFNFYLLYHKSIVSNMPAKKRSSTAESKKWDDKNQPSAETDAMIRNTADEAGLAVLESLSWSEDEADEESELPQLSDALTYTITFGKYKGEDLESVIRTGKGRNYLRYMIEEFSPESPNKALKAFTRNAKVVYYNTVKVMTQKRQKAN